MKYRLIWSGGGRRDVFTKGTSKRKPGRLQGERGLKAWKGWHERKGFLVVARGDGYIAYPPDFDRTTPIRSQLGIVPAIVLKSVVSS